MKQDKIDKAELKSAKNEKEKVGKVMQEYTRKKAKDAKKINTSVKELVERLLYYFSQPGFSFYVLILFGEI